MGPSAVSKNGENCVYWNVTVLPPSQVNEMLEQNKVLYNDPSTSSNLCRNVDYDPNGPWCFNDQLNKVTCGIPYCGKLKVAIHLLELTQFN